MNNRQKHVCTCALGAVALAMSSMSANAGPSFQVGEQGYVELSYAVQIWAQNRGYTSATDNGDVTDTFLRRNRITLNGQYNDYIGFYAQLEAGNDSKGGNNDRAVYYRDAYLTLDYSDEVRFILGRYKNTFSRENLEACLEPLTLDRGESLPYTPYGASRDTGITMWGNIADAKFQYRLSVTDGREGDEVVKDAPRLTGRVHVSLLDPEYSYGYRGTYLGTQTVLTIGAGYDSQGDIAYNNYTTMTGPKSYSASTYDIYYEQPFSFGTITASAAAFEYTVDGYPAIPDPTLTPAVERKGNYAKVGYLFPKPVGMGRLQLFARQDNIQYGNSTGLSDSAYTAVGANYYINGQSLKLTLEHATMKFDVEHPTDASLQDYNQTTLGLQMIF